MFRALIWRKLAPEMRRRFVTRVLEALAPVPHDEALSHPITVCGYLGASTGLGEAARLTAEALAQLGYDVRAVDISRFMLLDQAPGPNRAAPIEKGPGTLLLHFNPEALSVVLPLIGSARTAGKRIVGYWAWELSHIPRSWARALRFVDEVWAPSRFTAEAIARETSKPVRVVPHPVAIRPRGIARRTDFGISEGVFSVLCMFNFASSVDRKNPLAAIGAFKAAFADDPGAQLILKTSQAAQFPAAYRQVRLAVAGARNIRLIEADLDRAMVGDLVASVDAVLSLHRAEGFGLVMAEAMHAGTAVVGTAWSGNLDFMDDDSAILIPCEQVVSGGGDRFYWLRGQRWAEPDIQAAARALRRLAASPAERAKLAKRGQNHVARALGLSAFAQAMNDAVGSPSVGSARIGSGGSIRFPAHAFPSTASPA